MIMVIPVEEIDEKYRAHFKFGSIRNLSIDYATNSIHGYLEGEEVIIFNFSKFGIWLDNRRNLHLVSGGEPGILLQLYIDQET